MYQFNERSLIRSRIKTINSFIKKLILFSRLIAVCCCLNSEFLFSSNFLVENDVYFYLEIFKC